MTKKRYVQIDILKGIAMWMVLINHSYQYVYSSKMLFQISRSSVQILLFCSGINALLKLHSTFNNERACKENILQMIWKHFWQPKLISISIPYIAFNIIFYFFWHGCLEWEIIVQHIMGFNIANLMYFIPIYFELILFAPFLYYLVCRCDTKLWHCVLGLASFAICVFFAKYTYFFSVYGAGKYFVGATYGWVFLIGMMFGNRLIHKQNDAMSSQLPYFIPALIGIFVLWCISLRLFHNIHTEVENLFFNIGGNPPGLDSLVEGFLLICLIWVIVTCLNDKFDHSKVIKYLAKAPVACGKYSLYIYLWHIFVRDIFNRLIAVGGLPKQSFLYGVPFYLGSTVGVIFVKKAIELFKADISQTYLKNK